MSFTWQDGRKLTSLTGTGISANYVYNGDGLRTKKTIVEGTKQYTVEYFYEGNKLIALERTQGSTTDYMFFLYDQSDNIVGFELNGTAYYYSKNLQGDVLSILDSNGNVVVKYTYTAWVELVAVTDGNGNSITDTTSIAYLNPIRYRGYVYDDEIGMYYLQSRYYDPSIGRFINADSAEYIGASGTILGSNLFAYCDNNVVNKVDNTGYFSLKTALTKIKDFINKIVNSLWGYIKSLFKHNKKKRTLSIGTTVISTAIDALIAAVTNSMIYGGLKTGLKLLLRNGKIRNSVVGGVLDFFLYNKGGKILLWTIYKIGLSIAGKASALGTVTGSVFNGYLGNIITFKNKILQRASSLISAFSSIGGIVALFLDFSDKKWDDYVTIKY